MDKTGTELLPSEIHQKPHVTLFLKFFILKIKLVMCNSYFMVQVTHLIFFMYKAIYDVTKPTIYSTNRSQINNSTMSKSG